ncbi:MAG: class I mannose-6-phosphate isomerase [Silvanigrellaceae bacterium]|nr:class I mannose-6-phosphate isomerase [Silvanigrellaceae bacterium]
MIEKKILKVVPFNFVPFSKTPWGGKAISQLKRKYFASHDAHIPERIGESWEISTDSQYPSLVELNEQHIQPLTKILHTHSQQLLGDTFFQKYASHCPLLLKWINASSNLSVQLHPSNSNSKLGEDECGKPESWLVIENYEEQGYVYLGFKEGLSKNQIIKSLMKDELESCLFKYKPKKFDYISVPPGCVHAIGPELFLIEPQYILPNKQGKTWRISDWQRRYDEQGNLSVHGKPRQLHTAEAIEAIDWSLPTGNDIVANMIKNLSHEEIFLGNKYNPFAVQIFCQPGVVRYVPLQKNCFSLVTVWSGQVKLKTHHHRFEELKAGESALISCQADEILLTLENYLDDQPEVAFFTLNEEVMLLDGIY